MEGPTSDVCSLIAQKEQEIARLREGSLRQLEDKLRQREEELCALQAQLNSLLTDFQYNLELLDGRDAELAAYEAALQEATRQAEQKDTLVTAMQQAIGEAEAALVVEHEGRACAEGSLQQQRRALMQELDDVHNATARELELAQQAAVAKCSALEARLQEQQSERSELEKRHCESIAQMKAQHAKRIAELELRITVLEQLGQQREADLRAVQQEARTQTAHAAAVTMRLEDLQKEAKALASKADSMQRAQKAELLRQHHEKEALVQQFEQQRQAGEARTSELERRVEALQSAAVEQRAGSAAESSKERAAQQAQVQALEKQLADAIAQNAQLSSGLEEARAALEMQHSVLQEQLQRILEDKEAQIQALQQALEAQQRQFGADLGHMQSEAAADKEDLRAMAEQLAALEAYSHRQEQELANCRDNLASYEVQQAAARRGPSMPEWESMLKRVTLQRDEAQSAVQDFQAKLALREMEVRQLNQQLEASRQHTTMEFQSPAAPNWARCDGESSSSLPGGLLATHPNALPAALSAASHPGRAQEALAYRRALEAAEVHNTQLQAAIHALAAEMQQLQQAQLAAQAAAPPGPLQDATNTQKEARQAELRRLRKEVTCLRSHVQRLTADNDRLMEMSNALRAERNKLAATHCPLSQTCTPTYTVMSIPRPLWPSQGSSAAAVPQFAALALAHHQCQPAQPPLLLPSSANPVPSPEPDAAACCSVSPLPPADSSRGSPTAEFLKIFGRHMEAGSSKAAVPLAMSRAKPARPVAAAAAAQTAKQQQPAATSQPKPKVRNYNIKDDP